LKKAEIGSIMLMFNKIISNKEDFMDFSTTESKVKLVIRICAVILLVLFFVPTISVSCGDYEIEFSAFEAGAGLIDEKANDEFSDLFDELGDLSIDGDEAKSDEDEMDDIDPELIVFVFVIMALFVFRYATKKPLESAAMAGLSALCMQGLKYGTEYRIEEQMDFDEVNFSSFFEVDTTPWFSVHIAVCVIIIFIELYYGLFEKNPASKEFIKNAITNASQKNSSTESNASNNVCASCGNPVPQDAKFCGKCGAEYHEPKKTDKKFCTSCGTPYEEGTAFCSGCGKSLK
jgi:ribosomal protein L40E